MSVTLRFEVDTEKLYLSGYSEWEISFFTGIPGYIVREYIDIISLYEKENSNNN
jgi:hypothetical protein